MLHFEAYVSQSVTTCQPRKRHTSVAQFPKTVFEINENSFQGGNKATATASAILPHSHFEIEGARGEHSLEEPGSSQGAAQENPPTTDRSLQNSDPGGLGNEAQRESADKVEEDKASAEREKVPALDVNQFALCGKSTCATVAST